MSNYLSAAQVEQLLKAIHPARVSTRDDNGMSHLEAYDIRAHLNRIFGFGRWSADLTDLVQLYEEIGEKTNKDKSSTWQVVSVGYRATMRLVICAPDGTQLASYTEAAAGDATNFPMTKRADGHDFAIKTAESQALKRCVTNLGDQFGLSLYRKGSRAALVGRTLVGAEVDGAVDEHVEQVTPEHGAEVQPVTTHDDSGQATAPQASTGDPTVERTAPAAPVSSPEPARQEATPQTDANTPEHIAAKLREDGLSLFHGRQGRKRNEVIQDLGKVNIAAARAKVQQQQVRRENGEQVALGVFLAELIQACTKDAA